MLAPWSGVPVKSALHWNSEIEHLAQISHYFLGLSSSSLFPVSEKWALVRNLALVLTCPDVPSRSAALSSSPSANTVVFTPGPLKSLHLCPSPLPEQCCHPRLPGYIGHSACTLSPFQAILDMVARVIFSQCPCVHVTHLIASISLRQDQNPPHDLRAPKHQRYSHPTLTLAVWVVAPVLVLKCAVLSPSTGHFFWFILQFLVRPPTVLKSLSPPP